MHVTIIQNAIFRHEKNHQHKIHIAFRIIKLNFHDLASNLKALARLFGA